MGSGNERNTGTTEKLEKNQENYSNQQTVNVNMATST
jgi:hypothetical protein